MPTPDFTDLCDSLLVERAAGDLLRRRLIVEPIDATHVRRDGVERVNFCSNDYLGLTHHPAVIAAARDAAERWGVGAGASALITGHTPAHESCEQAIAAWKKTERAMLLPSGYQANHAAIQTLAAIAGRSGRTPLFLLDKRVHASLVDAVRATGLGHRSFHHQDADHLGHLLQKHHDAHCMVVTESVFSMDGDVLNVAAMAQLKAEHGFAMLVDEAHGAGAFGPDGAGVLAEHGACDLPDVTVVTLSKALGCAGGAICGSKKFIAVAENTARAAIYTTAPSPLLAAAAEAAIRVLRDEPARQDRLRANARRVRMELQLDPGPHGRIDSPIIPILLGESSAALAASNHLANKGLWVMAIRPPTVPRDGARLRVTVSCAHTDADMDRLVAGLREVRQRIEPGSVHRKAGKRPKS